LAIPVGRVAIIGLNTVIEEVSRMIKNIPEERVEKITDTMEKAIKELGGLKLNELLMVIGDLIMTAITESKPEHAEDVALYISTMVVLATNKALEKVFKERSNGIDIR